jgi:hypothetical protein
MWSSGEIAKRLIEAGLSGRVWGLSGPEAVQRIEGGLGIALGVQLRQFVWAAGNLMVSPFELVVAGDESGKYSAVTETQTLWGEYPALRESRLVQIMDHAGVVYLYQPENERVSAYDSFRPFLGEETLSWQSFAEFLDWIFREAKSIKNGCATFRPRGSGELE